MTAVLVNQMPSFKKVYKKLFVLQQKKVDEVICAMIKNPTIGQEKKGIYCMYSFINSKYIIKKCY